LGLPDARGAEEKDVLLTLDEREGGEFLEMVLRHATLEPGEVEAFEELRLGHAGELKPRAGGTLSTRPT
jgi:hypothetical protein